MLHYLLKRLWHTVYVVIGISMISFFFIHLSGDPVMLMLPGDASMQEVEQLRQKLGFNDPLYVQYGRFIKKAVQGDFGESLYYHVPALDLILERLPASLELSLAAMVLALVVSIPIGIISAVYRGSALDMGSMLGALFGLSMPRDGFRLAGGGAPGGAGDFQPGLSPGAVHRLYPRAHFCGRQPPGRPSLHLS